MGDEHEADVRREAFAGWQVDAELMAVAGPGRVLPALPARPPGRGGQRRGARRPARASCGSRPRTGCTRRGRCSSSSPLISPERTPDGDARQAATPAPPRPHARGAGDLEPGPDRGAARRGRRARDPGDGEPRPRGSRRGEGADPGRGDGLRGPGALEGQGTAGGPPPPGHGGVRRRGVALGQPRAAAHVAGLRARGRIGARPGRASRTCSATSPATTRSSSSAPRAPAELRSRRSSPSSPVSERKVT